MNPEFWTKLKAKENMKEIVEYGLTDECSRTSRQVAEALKRFSREADAETRTALVHAYRLGQLRMAAGAMRLFAEPLGERNYRKIVQKIARKQSSGRKRQVIQEVWNEFDRKDIKRRGKKVAYKETGEIAASRLGLKNPVPAETVRKYLS